MTVARVNYLQNLGAVFTAEETRRFLKLLGNRRAGVNVSGDLAVSQNGSPNMSVNVAAGEALVNGSETVTQGAYYLYNDAVLNRTIAASDPTNPRNDLVCLRVRDQVYSGTNNDGDVVVVTGTPAGSPVDPTPPANSLILARVVVGAGVTSIINANITDLRTWQSDKLVPGLSGFVLRNAADSQSNLNVSDAGIVTLRNALLIPPSVGGTLPPTSYGTVPVKIAETTLGSAALSVSFSSIPNGFRHLMLLWETRSTTTGSPTAFVMQFNGDTTANYDYQTTSAISTTVTAGQAIGAVSLRIGVLTNSVDFTGGTVHIINYASATLRRLMTAFAWRNDTGGPGMEWNAGNWRNTAQALNSIGMFAVVGNLDTGSVFSLYGLP